MWLGFRSMFLMVYCVIGAVLELTRSSETRDSQKFVMLWIGLFSGGFMEFCHINNILTESFWSFLGPFAFSFAIALQSVEEYPRTLEYFSWVSSCIVVPIVILSLVLVSQRQVTYSRSLKGSKQKPGRQGKTRSELDDNVNPMYSDISIYDGLVPGFIAFLLVLQGVVNWETAYKWKTNEAKGLTVDEKDADGNIIPFDTSHEAHGVLAQLIADIFISVCIIGFFSCVCKVIEKAKFANAEPREISIDTQHRTQGILYHDDHDS